MSVQFSEQRKSRWLERVLILNGSSLACGVLKFCGLCDRFDVGVDADGHGQAVDRGFGGLIALAAGHRERLAGG